MIPLWDNLVPIRHPNKTYIYIKIINIVNKIFIGNKVLWKRDKREWG